MKILILILAFSACAYAQEEDEYIIIRREPVNPFVEIIERQGYETRRFYEQQRIEQQEFYYNFQQQQALRGISAAIRASALENE